MNPDILTQAAELMVAIDDHATLLLQHAEGTWQIEAARQHKWLLYRLGWGKGTTIAVAVDNLLASLQRTAVERIAELRKDVYDNEAQAQADTLERLVFR